MVEEVRREEEADFVVATRSGKEKKRYKADRPPPEPEPEPEPEEKIETERKFRDLHKEILSDHTSDEDRMKLLGQMDDLMDEMEDLDVVDWEEIEETVIYAIRRSTWRDYDTELARLAESLEKEAQMTANFRSLSREDQEKCRGAISTAVKMAALELRVQGLEQRGTREELEERDETDDDYYAFLRRHASSPQKLRRDKIKVHRGRVIEFEAHLAALVGRDAEEKRGQVYPPQPEQRPSEQEPSAFQKQMLEMQARQLELQEKQLEASIAAMKVQEETVELMRKGYPGFLHIERLRIFYNPETFDNNLPDWYEKLGSVEQGIVRTRLFINYLAKVKERRGMMSLDDVVGVEAEIKREDLANMWERMPGFRVALATFIHDIFKENEDHFVISERGYEIMGDKKEFEKYKWGGGGLAQRIREYLRPRAEELKEKYGKDVEVKDLARAAVASVDNLLFASGVYDSADEKRAIATGEASMYSEFVRAWFRPGDRAIAKWILGEAESRPGVSEVGWGGPLGDWLRDNVAANRGGFRDKLKKGQLGFMPARFFYDIFGLTYFSSKAKDSSVRNKSLSEVLLEKDKRNISSGLYDYTNGAGAVDLNDLVPSELYGAYADLRSANVALYKHLTSYDPKMRLPPGALANFLIKCRKDPNLMRDGTFMNEDLITAAIGLLISPDGFQEGTTRMLLKLPNNEYDYRVTGVLNGNRRLFKGLGGRDFRKYLYKRFYALDTQSFGGSSPKSKEKKRRKRGWLIAGAQKRQKV